MSGRGSFGRRLVALLGPLLLAWALLLTVVPLVVGGRFDLSFLGVHVSQAAGAVERRVTWEAPVVVLVVVAGCWWRSRHRVEHPQRGSGRGGR